MPITVKTVCGEYTLNIIGDPDRILDVPISYFYGTLRKNKDCSNMSVSHREASDPNPKEDRCVQQ